MKHRTDRLSPSRPFANQALLGSSAAALLLAVAASCSASGGSADDPALARSARLAGHTGAAVDSGSEGTGRFVYPLLEAFGSKRAMATATKLDAEHRAPGSAGYEKGMDRLLADLYAAGFGVDTGFELDVLTTPMATPAWTPISAEISVVGARGRGKARIAGFTKPIDEQRVMIPVGGVGFEVSGAAVFDVEDVTPGAILVTDRSVRNVEQDAAEKGAAAVVSSFQLPYCLDPTGEKRHFDAIFSGTVRPGSQLPSLYVSPRTAENMLVATSSGSTFSMRAEVRTSIKDLRTVVAKIRGTDRADEVVYVVAHADGAGANDNAAGAAGIAELARSIKALIDDGTIPRPRRTIRFVFGRESQGGATAQEALDGTTVAAIVADMIGADYGRTGAVCLMERGWDPGALVSLPPDQHTPWGAGDVVEEDIVPNGLAIVIRQALVDVGRATSIDGGAPWSTREHPWEGGSDHDAFLAEGVAAALVWHFTDFSYSTSLDRIDQVDAEELRRTSVAIGAAALAVADLRPGDLDRYLQSLNFERATRIEAVRASDSEDKVALEELWKDWFTGARLWLRALSAGEALPRAEGMRSLDSIGDAR